MTVISNNNKDACYEYFGCKETDCIRRDMPTVNCWDIDDVRCKTHSESFETLKDRFGSKLEACKHCIFYQSQINNNI
jgi:hypothetical protein